MTLGAQITSLFIGFFSFYYYMVKLVIPNVLGINKLRIKKLSQNTTEKTFIEKEVNQFLKLVNYKLKVFLQKS
jgi:F0F1-type ATP synthase membrane subunit b/b'